MDKAATEGKRKDTGCMNTKFNRERIRFDVKQPDTLVIQGWFEDDTEGAEQFEAERNGAPAAIDVQVQRGVEVTKKYLRYKTNVMAEYFIRVPLTDTEKPGEVFEVSKNRKKTAVFPAVKVYHKTADGRRCIYHASASELLRISRHLMSWVEKLTVLPDGRYQLRGWYMGVERCRWRCWIMPDIRLRRNIRKAIGSIFWANFRKRCFPIHMRLNLHLQSRRTTICALP